MRIFRYFPDNGFYVVLKMFRTENMQFIPGEPVALVRMGTSSYVWIMKTGERFGGWSNYMETEFIPNLRRLSFEEASVLANGYVITADTLRLKDSLANACKAITGSVISLQKSTYRKGLLLGILAQFQDFDKGKEIEQLVPIAWNLEPGDHLEYEAGQNISGRAEVVSLGMRGKIRVWCTFKKVS